MNHQDVEDFWRNVDTPTQILRHTDSLLPPGCSERDEYFNVPNADGARPSKYLYVVVDATGKQITEEPESEREAYESMKVFREHAREGGYALPLSIRRAR